MTNSTSSNDITKPAPLFMNFWTPEFAPWGDNFDDASMPWYTSYEWVEVWDYRPDQDDFVKRWRDGFQGNDANLDKWEVSNNWTFEQNSTMFMESNVSIEQGKLRLRMNGKDW